MNAIVTTLFFSYLPVFGLVSNPTSSLPVTSYEISDDQTQVYVRGQFQNLCQGDPRIEVRKISPDEENVYELTVVSTEKSNGVCGQQIWGSYDLSLDLSTLDLPQETPIVIYFTGHANPTKTSVIINPRNTRVLTNTFQKTGTLVRISSFSREIIQYRYALQVYDSANGDFTNFPIQTKLSLDHYIGHKVSVRGHPLTRKNECMDLQKGSCASEKLGNLRLPRVISPNQIQLPTGGNMGAPLQMISVATTLN